MNLSNRRNHWEVDQSAVITPWRNYKSQRNKSLPDLNELSKTPSATPRQKIKYNKWFIKPELRLKQNIPGLQNTDRHFAENYFYESLYNTDPAQPQKAVPKRLAKQLRSSCVDEICADSQNLRMLSIYKHKKQTLSKRVPGVINYLLKYSAAQEEHRKKTDIRRRRLAA